MILRLAFVLLAAPLAAAQPGANVQSGRSAPADPAALERQLVEAVRRHPDSFEAHHVLAGFYLHHGKLEQGIPHLERAYALDPTHYENGYDLGLALLELGRVDAARTHVKRMLGRKETDELFNLLGDIEERAGNLLEAAEAYQRAAHMHASEENLFDWGNNLIQLRAFEPASQVLTEAVRRHPDSARLHVALGIVEYSRGQYGEAVKAFCRAVDLAPADARAYHFLGEMYGVAPELGEEITKRLAAFLERHPKDALAHLYYALSLWKGRPAGSAPADLSRVETLLRRAVSLDPRLAKGFLELGILLSDQQRFEDAISPLRRAAELDPEDPQPHYRLAQAYQRTGQTALAAKAFEQFERLDAKAR